MGRQLDPGDMQALHAELTLVMTLPSLENSNW